MRQRHQLFRLSRLALFERLARRDSGVQRWNPSAKLLTVGVDDLQISTVQQDGWVFFFSVKSKVFPRIVFDGLVLGDDVSAGHPAGNGPAYKSVAPYCVDVCT